ncbi:caspase family protein [Rhodopseudomonas parapalustris]
MARLGIVVAVSDYGGEKDLPACRRDGLAMARILKSAGRFDDVLHIDADTTAAVVKEKLADFAKLHQGKEIDEVLFYFTGHGEFFGDEFYYLLTDFQAKKRSQTSLENSELDGIVRALSPNLFVKIVDACQSGVSYIKSVDDISEYLKAADKKFRKLYFLFSSQSAQFSYQNEKISYFTEGIIKAVLDHSSGTIRYKDVMSYVSDAFEGMNFQTPLFVTQADFTEVFCEVSQELKDALKEFVQEEQVSAELMDASNPYKSLVSRLKEEAKNYCSREEAFESVARVQSILKSYQLPAELQELFGLRIEESLSSPPDAVAVGAWLDKGGDRKFFARPLRRMERYRKRVAKNPLLGLTGLSGVLGEDQVSYVDAERQVIVGVDYTTDMPFHFLSIRLLPKLPNLAPEECYVVPLMSRSYLKLFWAFSYFEYVDWESAERVGELQWSTGDVLLKDVVGIQGLVAQICSAFVMFVEESLKARWLAEDAVDTGN